MTGRPAHQRPDPELAVAYGIFSAAQACAAGYSRADRRRFLVRGRWQLIHRGILSATGRVEQSTDPIVTAVLRAGPKAVASHETAAAAFGWGLLRHPALIHVTVPPDQGRARSSPGVLVHRSAGEVDVVSGVLPTTGVSRTALDLAGTLPHLEAVVAVDSALRAKAVRLDELQHALRARRTWERTPHAAAVLAAASPLSGSVPESQARVLFALGGLPTPVEQLALRFDDYGPLLADFGWPEHLLVVEIDGYAFHNGESVLERDKRRQNALVRGGWKVLRYTPRDLRLRPDAVVEEIRCVLASAA